MAALSIAVLFCAVGAALSQDTYPKVVVSGVPKSTTDQIYFQLYEGPTVNDFHRIKFEDGLSLMKFPFFKKSLKTVFHFPGWGENPNEHKDSVDMLAEAFLSRRDVNFLVMDYSNLVNADLSVQYLGAALNASTIGNALGQYFNQYVKVIDPVDTLHLVSHSLGSQILSRTTKYFTEGPFKHLTGLDPAGPIFNLPGVRHLSAKDGEFVDIIHTDGYMYGEGETVGTVDFFPNRGVRKQPPCQGTKDYKFCSHHMSWRFYSQSVKNEKLYPAVKCERSLLCNIAFKSCKCNKDDVAYMGYGVDKTARGTYYIETEAEVPYKPIA